LRYECVATAYTTSPNFGEEGSDVMIEIKNARVWRNGKEEMKTIRIVDEKIVGVDSLHRECPVLDAKGLCAVPGLIDPHVHFRALGWEHKERWGSGSRAALFGGVTTVFDMPNTPRPLTSIEALEEKAEIVARTKPAVPIDYRFWFGALPTNIDVIRSLKNHSLFGLLAGVKVFMARSTGDLLVENDEDLREIFAACAHAGLMVGVHAEDEFLIQRKRKHFSHDVSVQLHGIIRNTKVETHAVARALHLQRETGCRLYFCHISTPEAIKLIAHAKNDGRKVYVEVASHHIIFPDTQLAGGGKNLFKMNPPLRSIEQARKLRKYVCQDSLVDTIGSDHAPHLYREKIHGEGQECEDPSYDQIPAGVPGVEALGPLMFDMVVRGEITLGRFIDLTSRNTARIFHLNKGEIAPGRDADITFFDTRGFTKFDHPGTRSRAGWTPYHGMMTNGTIRMVVAKGEIKAL
jgi:dihydroorotase